MRTEINGSEGNLILTAPTGRLQLADLKLEGRREEGKTVSEMVIPSFIMNWIKMYQLV